MTPRSLVAVVVTYNRRALLLECLAAIEAQTASVDEIIVVDNSSTDGTAEVIRERHPEVTLFELDSNIGGAGGFAFGVAAARPYAGAIWLMDDDAAPRPDALQRLLAARDRYAGATPVVLASRAVSDDGTPIPMNAPRRRPFSSRAERAAAAAAGCLPIRSASFVSVLVDGGAARRVELPMAGYFLWNDDFEYTARLLRNNVGLLCPDSVTVHAAVPNADPGHRFRYEVRNKIWLITRSHALAPGERMIYGAVSLYRWVGAIARSGNRSLLLRGLATGALEGLRSGPPPTADILAAATTSPISGQQRPQVRRLGDLEAEASARVRQPPDIAEDAGQCRA